MYKYVYVYIYMYIHIHICKLCNVYIYMYIISHQFSSSPLERLDSWGFLRRLLTWCKEIRRPNNEVLSGVLEVLSHEVSDADVGAMEIVDVC